MPQRGVDRSSDGACVANVEDRLVPVKCNAVRLLARIVNHKDRTGLGIIAIAGRRQLRRSVRQSIEPRVLYSIVSPTLSHSITRYIRGSVKKMSPVRGCTTRSSTVLK